MLFRLILLLPIVLTAFFPARTASAAGTVRLELIGDPRETSLILQDWAQALDRSGIRNVRLRTDKEEVKPGIETQGAPDHPLYIVTGRILSQQELLLPGEKFKRGDLGRLKKWLDDLAEQGPPDRRPAKAAFGLSQPLFQKVKEDLSPPLGFSTVGVSRREAVETVARQLHHPLRMDQAIAQDLDQEKVQQELSAVSRGTALACILRSAEYGLVPQVDGGRITYIVEKSQPDRPEVWPVGRPPEERLPKLLPALYEFLNVNVQNYPVATTAETIGKRLHTPILYDRRALARQGIDPTKILVTLPQSRTTYSTALRKLLGKARLKYEVRVDDSGAPFLWITTLQRP
ncbi:MAG: hypothetical protein JXB10_10705 [Pirellulales bacterium]|nr:hypothetical protein [Pirellulales bacterium]